MKRISKRFALFVVSAGTIISIAFLGIAGTAEAYIIIIGVVIVLQSISVR